MVVGSGGDCEEGSGGRQRRGFMSDNCAAWQCDVMLVIEALCNEGDYYDIMRSNNKKEWVEVLLI